jgi:hypothetical protein
MTEPKTRTLDAPGAVLYYDVRSNDASDQPVLPDREALLATATGIHETYLRDGFGSAMAKFIALVGQNIVSCNTYRHDFDAIAKAPTRVVIGVGEKSGQTMAARAGRAVAERLGTTPVTFPGDHGGFLPADVNPNGAPDAFAATLRETLAG